MSGLMVRRLAGALLLVIALLLGATGISGYVGGPGAPLAPAVAVAGNDDDGDEEEDEDDDDGFPGEDNEDEREINGQVVSPAPGVPGVNRNVSPPEIYVVDDAGITTVRVIRPEAIDESGVREGDHVSIDGERITDVLFDGTDIEVRDRCCPDPEEDDD